MADLSTKAVWPPVDKTVALAVMSSVTLIVAAFWYVRSLPNQPPPLVLSETDLQQMAIDPLVDKSDDNANTPTDTAPTSGFTSAVARFGNMSAYGEHQGSTNVLILTNGLSTITVATGTNVAGVRNTVFGLTSFSPRGRYLLYHRIGWEWSSHVIYDIAAGKTVLTVGGGDGVFNASETLFYTCFINHFDGSREANVYKVPGFILALDLYQQFPELQNFNSLECREDRQNNALVFDFSGLRSNDGSPDQDDVHRVFKADLSTGALLAP